MVGSKGLAIARIGGIVLPMINGGDISPDRIARIVGELLSVLRDAGITPEFAAIALADALGTNADAREYFRAVELHLAAILALRDARNHS